MYIFDLANMPSVVKELAITTQKILTQVSKMSIAIDRLRAEIAEAKTVSEGAAALLADLSIRLRSATDMSEIAALAEELDAYNASLASAIAENTIAAE